jgi:hypothetical protein
LPLGTTTSIGGVEAKASLNAYSAWHNGQRTMMAESSISGNVTRRVHRGQVEMFSMANPCISGDFSSLTRIEK